jgi:UDP-glucose 4-epimerase
MKVLVTGGAGFIGKQLLIRLVSEGHTVTSVDRRMVLDKHRVEGVNYIPCNTRDISWLGIAGGFDVLYHMGEYSRISTSFEDVELVWESNIWGTFNVIEYCKKNNIKLVYAASSSKFGNDGQDENLSPYAWTKSKNVELIKNYNSWYGLDYSIAYFYNVYGPGQVSTGKYSTVIGIFENQYASNEPLSVVLPGTQRRFFTHVADVVDGLVKLLTKGTNEEFCFGDPESNYSIDEVAKMFTKNIKYIDNKKGDRVGSPLDISNSEQLLGWAAKNKLIDYIKEIKK